MEKVKLKRSRKGVYWWNLKRLRGLVDITRSASNKRRYIITYNLPAVGDFKTIKEAKKQAIPQLKRIVKKFEEAMEV